MDTPIDGNATRIIVQNLSFGTSQEDLAAFFRNFIGVDAEVGDVLVAVEPSGRSKGFGFVTFASNESLRKAIAHEGLELDGRTLRVQVANPLRKDSEKRGPRPSREIKATGPKLYCGDLPWELSSTELATHFEQWGKVEDAYLAEVQFAAQVNGYKPHRGFGFVVYSSEEEATKALQQSKHVIKGATIRVTSAKADSNERRRAPRADRERKEGSSDEKPAKREGGEKREGGASAKRAPKESGAPKEGAARKVDEAKDEARADRKKKPTAAGGAATGATADDEKKDRKEGAANKEAKKAPERTQTKKKADVRVPPAPKVSPWTKKGDAGSSAAVSAEDYPTLSDVATGKVKAKVVDDSPPVVTAPVSEKGKEEAN